MVDGKRFIMDENPMGIREIKLTFDGDGGVLNYINAQGEKKLEFGISKNVFTDFPEEGYADEVGTEFAAGRYYKCAVSAAWTEPTKLAIMVQAIDEYFGRMYMAISFKRENKVAILCTKTAEDFFDEYCGYAEGTQA